MRRLKASILIIEFITLITHCVWSWQKRRKKWILMTLFSQTMLSTPMPWGKQVTSLSQVSSQPLLIDWWLGSQQWQNANANLTQFSWHNSVHLFNSVLFLINWLTQFFWCNSILDLIILFHWLTCTQSAHSTLLTQFNSLFNSALSLINWIHWAHSI